jgi:hypothetical protein
VIGWHGHESTEYLRFDLGRNSNAGLAGGSYWLKAASGLGANWADVIGVAVTNQMSFPIDPSNRVVFFRMAFP